MITARIIVVLIFILNIYLTLSSIAKKILSYLYIL